MVNKNDLKIVNDTYFDVGFYIKHDDAKPEFVNLKKNGMFSIKEFSIKLEISKEDVWRQKNRLSKFLLLIYSFDLIFGNMSESENLPFSILYCIGNEKIETKNQEIYLSKLLMTDEASIGSWNKISTMQIFFIILLCILVQAVLSFMFSLWVKVIFAGVCLFGNIILLVKLIQSKNKIKQSLSGVLNRNK